MRGPYDDGYREGDDEKGRGAPGENGLFEAPAVGSTRDAPARGGIVVQIPVLTTTLNPFTTFFFCWCVTDAVSTLTLPEHRVPALVEGSRARRVAARGRPRARRNASADRARASAGVSSRCAAVRPGGGTERPVPRTREQGQHDDRAQHRVRGDPRAAVHRVRGRLEHDERLLVARDPRPHRREHLLLRHRHQRQDRLAHHVQGRQQARARRLGEPLAVPEDVVLLARVPRARAVVPRDCVRGGARGIQ